MELRNCPECDKLFTFISINLCSECQVKDEEEFKKVRKHLKDNPDKSIGELAEETEVEERKIARWVREGRFQSKFFTRISVPCENCGIPINGGRYCSDCSKSLADVLQKSVSSAQKEMKGSSESKSSGYRSRRF